MATPPDGEPKEPSFNRAWRVIAERPRLEPPITESRPRKQRIAKPFARKLRNGGGRRIVNDFRQSGINCRGILPQAPRRASAARRRGCASNMLRDASRTAAKIDKPNAPAEHGGRTSGTGGRRHGGEGIEERRSRRHAGVGMTDPRRSGLMRGPARRSTLASRRRRIGQVLSSRLTGAAGC